MATIKYKPDHKGTRELLRTPEMRRLARQAAEKIAAKVVDANHPDMDVTVDEYTTKGLDERPAASVTIREPYALRLQARDGILTRAAASVGIEVRK